MNDAKRACLISRLIDALEHRRSRGMGGSLRRGRRMGGTGWSAHLGTRRPQGEVLRRSCSKRPPTRSSTVDALVAEGDVVAEEGRYTGTHTGTWRNPNGAEIPPTGKSLDFAFSAIFRVRDGKITSIRLYYDQMEVLDATRAGASACCGLEPKSTPSSPGRSSRPPDRVFVSVRVRLKITSIRLVPRGRLGVSRQSLGCDHSCAAGVRPDAGATGMTAHTRGRSNPGEGRCSAGRRLRSKHALSGRLPARVHPLP